jgi:UPF0755 protein
MYDLNTKRRKLPKLWLIAATTALVLAIGGVVGLRGWYVHNLGPVSSVQTTQYFNVASGETVHQIGINLKKAGLIRSIGAFEAYARGHELIGQLQAGTYELSPSMGTRKIVAKLASGEVASDLVTILPGQTLGQIKKTFAKAGYSQPEIDKAFDSAAYSAHPLLAALPQGVSLEGLLYPDSFQKSPTTPAQTLVRESLDEMHAKLTPAIQAGFAAQGLNLYQGIVLASIVQKEVDEPTYQPTVAQVFYKRLRQGMMLQSDVTTFYAINQHDNSYDTYQVHGLPPGPISSMTSSPLQAVAHPSNTDYLYFIAGDNGKLYFARTPEEHQSNINKYCHAKCPQ